MMNRIQIWFPTLAPLIRRYATLSLRERVLVNTAAGLFVILLLVYGVLFPSIEYRDSILQEQLMLARGIEWMEANQEQAKRNSTESSGVQGDSRLTSLSSSASLNSVAIKRMQPGDNQISVELAGQEYLKVIKWLVSLETEYGFRLVDMRLDKSENGVVDSRITLR